MKSDQSYSILARIRAVCAGTWGKIDSAEWRITSDLHERFGVPNSGYDLMPGYALRATPLSTVSPNGGFLDGTALKGYLAALQPQCNVLKLGATTVQLGQGSTTIPRGVTAIVPTYQPDQVTATVATAPTFGSVVFQRKDTLTAVTLSLQQIKQSDAEIIVPQEITAGLAASFDKQALQGTGLLGTPLGILNMPAISTASGASLAYSSVVTQMTNVANANAVVNADALGFLTNPTTAGLLKQRQFSTAAFPIWNGSVPSGLIDAQPALSSTNCPVGALIHADWSRLLIAEWSDGLQIAIDPFSNFQQGWVTIRICASVDFAVASPLSFSILTGVT
jgi:HK97 family phage major capsid protein